MGVSPFPSALEFAPSKVSRYPFQKYSECFRLDSGLCLAARISFGLRCGSHRDLRFARWVAGMEGI
jgi:hypothetical protein